MPQEFKVKNGLIVDQGGAIITGSVIATSGFTGSFSGSFTGLIDSASNAATASFLNTLNQDLTFNGNLALNGTASINTLIVNQTQYSSGSNQLGDAANDTQTLFGSVIIPTGSLVVSGSSRISGDLTATGSLTVSGSAIINTLTVGLGGGQVSNNMAIGADALRVNTTGTTNTAIGNSTLRANTIGVENVAVGHNAIRLNVSGSYNTAVGNFALYNSIGGNGHTAIGYSALNANTTGYNNSTVGFHNLSTNTTGYENSSVGYETLRLNTTGYHNSAVGAYALRANTTGIQNVAVGLNAGRFIADGSANNTITNNSIYIGVNTKALADNQTNQIVIGDNITGLGSNTVTLGNNSITRTALKGNVSVGTTGSISSRLHIQGSGATSATTALRVENTNASASLVVLDNGFVGINTGSAQNNLDVNGTARVSGELTLNSSIRSTQGNNLNMLIGNFALQLTSTNPQNTNGSLITTGDITRTDSGTKSIINVNNLVSSTAAAFNVLNGYAFTSNITQTQGTIRGLFIAPTLTTSTDFRAIENSVGKVCLNTTSGNTMIGTTTDAGFKLDVSGSGRFTNGLTVTGSLIAPTITGSLLGTASYATQALSASFAPSTPTFPFNGSAVITGSLIVSGANSSIDTNYVGDGLFVRDGNGTGAVYINTTERTLRDAGSGQVSVDWANRILNDATPASSIDWTTRELYTPSGVVALNYGTVTDDTTTSNLYSSNIIANVTQRDLSRNTLFAGHIIEGTIDVGATLYDIMYLDTDGIWYSLKNLPTISTKMLGIWVGDGNVLIDGDMTVSDDGSVGNYTVNADHGLPVYLSTTTGRLTTTVPTVDVVRIVGHIYYQDPANTNVWLMKFRPSNEWYEI